MGFEKGRRIAIRYILRNPEAQTPSPPPHRSLPQPGNRLARLLSLWDSGIRGVRGLEVSGSIPGLGIKDSRFAALALRDLSLRNTSLSKSW